MRVALRLLVLVAAWAVASSVAPRAACATERSGLEERSLARALGPNPDFDDAPQGKRIESIQVVRLPVFDEDDPVPDLLNVFHAQTRERVIRGELLFRRGQRYDEERIQETIRNLQLLPQFGVVVVVALRGTEPGQVRVVVIVRDVWSLRPAWELKGSPSYVNYLVVNLVETNLFGTRASMGGIFSLRSDRYSLGAMGRYPRIAGTKIDAFGQALAFVNQASGKVEGSFGAFAVHRDLVSLDDKWGFLAGVAWLNEWTRVPSSSSGVAIQYWPPAAHIENRLLEVNGIPLEYRTSVLRTGAEVARQYGRRDKTIVTGGVEFSRRHFEPPPAAATASAADFAAFVRDEVPVSDNRLSPFIEVENRSTKYLVTRDVETLELQESFTLGQHAVLRLYPALRGVGSSRNLLGSVAWLGYTQRLGDGFARAVVSSSIEAVNSGRHQAFVQGAFRIVSPRVAFLRVVLDYAAVETYYNYLNRKLALGGESRPRGYVNSGLRGGSGFAGTLELRTGAVDVLSARAGAVAFFDVAGAGSSIHTATPAHSVGAGIRILFPQFNREIFRVDWAVPLTPSAARVPNRALPGAFYFSFGQAFDLPRVRLPEVLGTPNSLVELVE